MADVIFMKSDHELHAVLRCFTKRRGFIFVEVLVENRDEEEARKYTCIVICRILQVLQHVHLHSIFHS